jgi:hypothetical protein
MMRFAPGPLGRPLTPHQEICSCPSAQEARHKAGKRKDTDDTPPLLGCDCDECTKYRLWEEADMEYLRDE